MTPPSKSKSKISAKALTQKISDKDKALQAILSFINDIQKANSKILTSQKTQKSRNAIAKIITSAHEIFIKNGHSKLTLREVANNAGMAVGNLTYHFQSKDALIVMMLQRSLSNHLQAHLLRFDHQRMTPGEILLSTVEYHLLRAAKTHRFMYQLWGYAGSSSKAKLFVRELYQPIERYIYYLVCAANPKLSDLQARQAAFQIISISEGYKLFVGLGPAQSPAVASAGEDIQALTQHIIAGNAYV